MNSAEWGQSQWEEDRQQVPAGILTRDDGELRMGGGTMQPVPRPESLPSIQPVLLVPRNISGRGVDDSV